MSGLNAPVHMLFILTHNQALQTVSMIVMIKRGDGAAQRACKRISTQNLQLKTHTVNSYIQLSTSTEIPKHKLISIKSSKHVQMAIHKNEKYSRSNVGGVLRYDGATKNNPHSIFTRTAMSEPTFRKHQHHHHHHHHQHQQQQ